MLKNEEPKKKKSNEKDSPSVFKKKKQTAKSNVKSEGKVESRLATKPKEIISEKVIQKEDIKQQEKTFKGGLLKFPIASKDELPIKQIKAKAKAKASISDSFELLQKPNNESLDDSTINKKKLYKKYLSEVVKEPELSTFAAKINRHEISIQKIFEENRKNKEWIFDFCTIGPMKIAPELMKLKNELTDMYLQFLTSDFTTALNCKLVVNFWAINKRIIDLFQVTLNSSSANLNNHKNQISINYLEEMRVIHENLASIFKIYHTNLKSYTKDENFNLNINKSIKDGLQLLSLSLGDISRYRENEYCRIDPGRSPDYNHAEYCYFYGYLIAPWNGFALKSASLIPKLQRNPFHTVYYLLRSMCVENPYDGHEVLLAIFEHQNTMTDSFQSYTALSNLSMDEHTERFISHFLSCEGIAYSRVGADKFTSHLEKCKLHLSLIFQALELQFNKSMSSKTSYLKFDTSSSDFTVHNVDSLLSEALNHPSIYIVDRIDKILYNSLVSTIALIHLIMKRHDFSSKLKSFTWSNDDETYMSEVDYKRISIQYLHTLQSIPGLVDLFKLVFGMISSIIGIKGIITDHSKNIGSLKLLASLRTVSLFLDWLYFNENVWIYSIIDKHLWIHLENNLLNFLSSIPRDIDNYQYDQISSFNNDRKHLHGFLPLAPPQNNPDDFYLLGISHPDCECDGCFDSQILNHQDDMSMRYSKNNIMYNLMNCKRILSLLYQKELIIMDLNDQPLLAFNLNREFLNPAICKNENFEFLKVFSTFDKVYFDKFVSPNNLNFPCKSSIDEMISKASLITLEEESENKYCKKVNIENEEGEKEKEEEEKLSDISDDEIFVHSKSSTNEKSSHHTNIRNNSTDCQMNPSRTLAVDYIQLSKGKQNDREKNSKKASKKTTEHQKNNVDTSKTYMKQKSSIFKILSTEMPLIVVDAPNVAMKHGMNEKFSCKGIKLVMDFFHTAGHKVVAFMPEYYLQFEKVGELRRLAKLQISDVRAAKLPDDINLLQQLVNLGYIISTPPQDYDDSYSIAYAKSHNGYLVTNDLYRDHVKNIENPKLREDTRIWLKSHCISFTFIGDEFLPNPDASFEK